MQKLAELVSQATSVPVAPSDIEWVLRAFMVTGDIWQAQSLAGRPFPVVTETAHILSQQGLADLDGGVVSLTPRGREMCRELGLAARRRSSCDFCHGSGIDLAMFSDILPAFSAIAAERPEPLIELDQAPVTPETTLRRLALMADRGDLEGKNLLVLGDDDLVGLAAALSGLPHRVVVLELDARLVDFMREQGPSPKLEVVQHDLREPLPADLQGRLDTFFTDPPDTLDGLELFIARGISALRGSGRAGYFGISLIEASLHRWRQLQDVLVGDYRVVITDVLRDFSLYQNWPYLMNSVRQDLEPLKREPAAPWYTSALYRIEMLPDSVLSASHQKRARARASLYTSPESILASRRADGAMGSS